MNWTNELTSLLHITYPIVQAPMFGVTTPEMVAAASNSNTLGSLALADLGAEQSISLIRKTKQLTDKPFAVNIFTHDIPPITDSLREAYDKTKNVIEQLAGQHGLQVTLPTIDSLQLTSYHDQLDVIISENCKIVSFTFGIPDKASIDKLKANDTILIGTCNSLAEAIALEQAGIDIICVQGWEAGGHRGTFTTQNIPTIGGFSLLAQVRQNVHVPVLYAGGIYNAQTILAARTLGAEGFQVGSLLLASRESALQDFEIERLHNTHETDITLTRAFSGRYARGIRNTFISALEDTEFILPYPYQNKLTSELRRVARETKNTEFIAIWAGQSLPELSQESTGTILSNLIDQTERYYAKS